MKPWTKTMDTLSEKWNIRLTYFIHMNERVLLFSQQYCKISRNQNRAWQYLKVTSKWMNYSYPPISFFSLTLSVRGILKKCTVSPVFASVRCTCTFKKVYDSPISFPPNTNEHVPWILMSRSSLTKATAAETSQSFAGLHRLRHGIHAALKNEVLKKTWSGCGICLCLSYF